VYQNGPRNRLGYETGSVTRKPRLLAAALCATIRGVSSFDLVNAVVAVRRGALESGARPGRLLRRDG